MSLNLSSLSPIPGSRKRRKRVGCGEGSGHGKTSCRGGKGQTARTGGGVRAGFEGGQMPLYRRLPKYGFVSSQQVAGINRYAVVNLSFLDGFENGATVDYQALRERGFSGSSSCKAGIKILCSGKLTKKLHVKAAAFSAKARQAIETLGGTAEVVASK